jgi:hypothetical protein
MPVNFFPLHLKYKDYSESKTARDIFFSRNGSAAV